MLVRVDEKFVMELKIRCIENETFIDVRSHVEFILWFVDREKLFLLIIQWRIIFIGNKNLGI